MYLLKCYENFVVASWKHVVAAVFFIEFIVQF
jgi:hypothetical protein